MAVFPNDADGQVLKMLAKQGVDFKQPQSVEFVVVVPDKQRGEAVLDTLTSEGFTCELEYDEEMEEWTCYCFKTMLLTHEEIIDTQKRLDDLSKPYDGYTEGWGLMVK